MRKAFIAIALFLLPAFAFATVTGTATNVSFACTGSAGPFPFTFPIIGANAMEVIQNGVTLSTSAYTISPVNANYANGGSVTLNTACPSSQTLVLKRVTPVTQLTKYTTNMPALPENVENNVDQLTEIAQETYADFWLQPLYSATVPTGFCSPNNQVEYVTGSGIPYPQFTCVNGAWTQTGGGGGGGGGCLGGTCVNGYDIVPKSVIASVNNVINVQAPPYNAKGDCSTDDFTPITTAMTYANTFTPPLTVVFPNPPGGCYLTSTLTWLGVPLEGRAPMGILPAQGTAGVVIQGEPGEDIFHAPDPTLVSTPIPNKSWSIRDINFIVDSSVDVSATIGAHRWPGRWVQDAGMAASSAVITSPHAMFTCGDVGQAIEVMGAGLAGAPLVSTIASVVPCAPIGNATYPQGATVTLAATASTTVTAGTGTAYISVAGLSVTQTVGNAAIAFDCKDGDRTHYTMGGGAGYVETEVDELTNIKVASTTGTNNSAGIFMQGCWASYDLRALNVWLNGLTFGGVFVPSELDSYQTTGLRDYLNWTGGELEATYPWISYDGSDGTMTQVQVFSGDYGPQILDSGTFNQDLAYNWNISVPESEGPITGNYGWRIQGAGHTITNTGLGGDINAAIGPTWDAVDSTCIGCSWFGTFTVNGSRNHLETVGSLQTVIPVDNGVGNKIIQRGYYESGNSASRSSVVNQTIFDQPVGSRTADSFRNGNAGAYPSDLDLTFGPDDFLTGATNDAAQVSADSTALFGKTYLFNTSVPLGLVQAFYSMIAPGYSGGGGALIGPGQEVPAMKSVVYANGKCATSTSYTVTLLAIVYGTTYTTVGTISGVCSASYHKGTPDDPTPSTTIDLTSYTGRTFGFQVSSPSNDLKLEFVGIRPYYADLNVSGQMLSASILGPATAPSGACTVNGQWELSQDGAITKCVSGTWTTFSSGGSIPGGALGSVPYQTAPGATGLTAPNTSASTLCLTETGTGSVGAAPTWGSCAGSAATAFSALTSSTNTSAAMVVGSGASLDFTGTGTIDANLVNGAVVPASAGFVATNSSRQLVAAAYTPANCTAGTTGSNCLQLTSGLVPVGNIPTAIPIANIGSAGLSGTAPVSIASTGAISMHVADASDNGYLSSTDWSTFNSKQAALTNPVTGPASPTAGYLTKWGPSGDAIVDGVKLGTMTDTDWCTFTTANGLQCTSAAPGGSGLSGMTSGQVAIAGSATTITSSKALAGSGAAIVTGPASSTTNDVAGFTGASGQIQDLGFLYTAYPAADIAAGALANGMTATTQTLGDNTTKLATDAFVIANAGSGCGNALTMNNGGSGAASGSTFNCGAAVTLSYNTIGAAPALGNNVGETVGWTLATNTVYRFTGSGASNATTPASVTAGFISSIQNTGTAAVTVVTGGPTLHCEPSSCVVQIGGSALVTTDANGTDFDEIASNANGSAFGTAANANTTGAGAAVPTGPTSSTTTDLVSYTGTSGQQQDSGIASANVTQTTATPAANQICVYGSTAKTCTPTTTLPSAAIPSAIPIGDVGSAGLSGSGGVSIASTGAISLSAIPIGSVGSAGLSGSGGVSIASTGAISLSGIPLTAIATQAADTVDMNATAGSASPTAVAMPTATAGADLYNTTTHAWTNVLTSVTNDAQTKAAVVPNTAPSAGQLLVGNAGGTAYAPVTASGDATLVSTGAISVTKINGNTPGNSCTNQFERSISSSAVGTCASIAGADLPNPSASTLGGIESITSASHNWVSYIDTSGVPHQSQPAVADVTGAAPTASPTFTGTLTYPLIATTTNCAAAGSAANPSLVACSAAPSGSFSCATNASTGTCVVSTTAVTANSRIFVQPSSAEGANLSVTCNTTADTGLTAPRLSAKSAGTSFTINLGTFSTNPMCFNYWIVN